MHAFLCAPGFESVLADELGGRVLVPGVVTTPAADGPRDPVYGRQVLPNARRISGESIRGLARDALDAVWPALKAQMTWRLDVITSDAPAESAPGELARRASLLDGVLREEVRGRRTGLFKVLGDSPSSARLQVLLTHRDQALVSLSAPRQLGCGALWPSPFAAGRVPVLADKRPPSLAYRKLTEALAWLRHAPLPGERVVDLGASPGGWSWVLLEHGALVLGVDKGAMHPSILERPGFTHARRDGFTYEPEAPVDWLVCDIIAEPEKSAALFERWTAARWYRRAVFHLKMRGQPERALIDRAVECATRAGYTSVRCKHLAHDKNEVTLMVQGAP